MPFFSKKLDREDLEELKEREKLIREFKLIVQALEFQKQVFITSRYAKYKMENGKEYDIDLITGKIQEVKSPPKQP